jgi:hypothetical protein
MFIYANKDNILLKEIIAVMVVNKSGFCLLEHNLDGQLIKARLLKKVSSNLTHLKT